MSAYEYLEEWLPIVGYEGLYEVSNIGRVRRVAGSQDGNRGKLNRGRLLSLFANGSCRYLSVMLAKNGKGKTFFVHVLVANTFLGPCPIGSEAHHRDEDKYNNFVGNLRYLSHSKHKHKHIRKLTKQEVVEIRRLHKEGFNQTDLADKFSVTQSHVSRIVGKQSWEVI